MKLTQVEITTIQLYMQQVKVVQGQLQAYIGEQIMGNRKLDPQKKYDLNTTTWELEEVKPPVTNK